jgi:hypothetical protein
LQPRTTFVSSSRTLGIFLCYLVFTGVFLSHDFLSRSSARLIWTHNMKNITYQQSFTPEGGNTSVEDGEWSRCNVPYRESQVCHKFSPWEPVYNGRRPMQLRIPKTNSSLAGSVLVETLEAPEGGFQVVGIVLSLHSMDSVSWLPDGQKSSSNIL